MIVGSNIDSVRRRNLSAVLTLIHRGGPVSRAAITVATGLNRSTVADLVAELEQLGLLIEGGPLATARVGRPSPLVSAAPTPVVLAINPELDAVTIGVVGLGATVDTVVRREVDRILEPEEVVDLVASTVAGLTVPGGALADARVLGAGVAVPGLVRAEDHVVRWAPHLGWRDVPLAELLAERLGIPVQVGNDASLGALAEQLFGAGRGHRDLVYLNGGASGIGGGVVVDGRVVGGTSGYAGEFGQNKPAADPADRRSPGGTLEDEVSRTRLIALLGLPLTIDEPSLEAALLASRDPELRAELDRQQRILAVALSNAINVLNPQRVILGGFLASLLAADPEGLGELVAGHALEAAWSTTALSAAALGSRRLLIGAAEIALAPLLANPTGR